MVDGQLNQHCILLCIGFEFIIFNVILKNLNNQNVNLIWQIYKISFNNFKEYKCTKFSVISLRINELQKKYGCRLFYRGHCKKRKHLACHYNTFTPCTFVLVGLRRRSSTWCCSIVMKSHDHKLQCSNH